MFRNDVRVYIILLAFLGIGQTLRFIQKEDANPDLLVQCNDGLLQGSTKQTFRKHVEYFAYQGIPFAEPPVADLRFKDPIPSKKWSNSGVLDATTEQLGCTNSPFYSDLIDPIRSNTSEDCLYLNVYVPKIGNNQSLLPVIIWIYGGSFITGSSNAKHYGPDYYLETGVVVVTLNYRLGILGFLSTGDLACPGNMGLKDQHLAIKWTKENIKNFGGDPEAITVSGQSAGAVSAHYHMLSPKSKGLFRAVIAQSGTALHPWARQKNAREIAFQSGYFMGVVTKDSQDLVDRMRKVDVEKIRMAEDIMIVLYMVLSLGAELTYVPVIEPPHGGAFITQSNYEACEKGDFMKVPIMTGVTSQEAGLFQKLWTTITPYLSLADAFQSTLLFRSFDFDSVSTKNEAIQAVKDKYIQSGKFSSASLAEIIQYCTDDAFVKSAVKTAQLLSPHVPVYFYQLTFTGRSALKALLQKGRLVKGTYHAEELFYLWRRSDVPVMTPSEEEFIDVLSTMWSNFVKYGDPTPSRDQKLDNVIWDPVKTSKVNYLKIGKRLAKKNEVDFIDMNFWDTLLDKYAKKPYITY